MFFRVMLLKINKVFCAYYYVNPVYPSCNNRYQPCELRMSHQPPVQSEVHKIASYPLEQVSLPPPRCTYQQQPQPFLPTDCFKLMEMVGKNPWLNNFQREDETMKQRYSAEFVTPHADKGRFISKLEQIIGERRIKSIRNGHEIPIPRLISLTLYALNYDEKQVGLFIIFYNFTGRGFTTDNSCVKFSGDSLSVRKHKEHVLNEEKLMANLQTWKRLNFQFNTLFEAYEILRVFISKLTLDCYDYSAKGHIDFFKKRVLQDLIILWGTE